ncbi:MAG: type III pantothenate kinase [Clostridiales bacterium]|nr:type III pantothenate kinase [Clostridiales bacterium]
MLLVVDVGNTNITLGIFKEKELIGTFRMTTKVARTSDEYGIFIRELILTRGIQPENIEAVIISSVVPNIMHSFKNGIIKYLNVTPIIVGAGTKTGIKIATANPREVGPDRIVDLVAAYETYGGPLIVIDFGTATTYDLILEDGSFVAGLTSPGIRICANALWSDTAALPEVEIKKPDSILAKDTVTSMQAGLVYGYIGQTEYIIKKMKEESGIKDIKVVATGGLGKIIADATEEIHIYDSALTMNGLRLIYEKFRSRKN